MAKNNFDDLRSTLLDTFNTVAEKVLNLADTAADTAKTGHQIAKLTMEKRKAESAIQEAYEQLGKLYYDMHRDDAEGVFADLCGDIDSGHDRILDIEDEISVLKEAMGSAMEDIEVEFSEIFEDEDVPTADDADFESVVTGIEETADAPASPEETAPEETAPEETPAEDAPDQEG